MKLTADSAREIVANSSYKRETLEALIRMEAGHGRDYVYVQRARLTDSMELDLVVDGFDVAPCSSEDLLFISWK